MQSVDLTRPNNKYKIQKNLQRTNNLNLHQKPKKYRYRQMVQNQLNNQQQKITELQAKLDKLHIPIQKMEAQFQNSLFDIENQKITQININESNFYQQYNTFQKCLLTIQPVQITEKQQNNQIKKYKNQSIKQSQWNRNQQGVQQQQHLSFLNQYQKLNKQFSKIQAKIDELLSDNIKNRNLKQQVEFTSKRIYENTVQNLAKKKQKQIEIDYLNPGLIKNKLQLSQKTFDNINEINVKLDKKMKQLFSKLCQKQKQNRKKNNTKKMQNLRTNFKQISYHNQQQKPFNHKKHRC